MDFRTAVKRICQEKGILQKDLAKKLGITAVGLSQTLRQEYPQLQTLERIAEALGVEVVELFNAPQSTNTIQCPKCGAVLELKEKA